MYWRITEDLINTGSDGIHSRVNRSNGHHDGEPLLTVRLLDDDEIHYYTAVTTDDEDSLESLFYYCQRDAGTTIMQSKNRDGKWVDEIA